MRTLTYAPTIMTIYSCQQFSSEFYKRNLKSITGLKYHSAQIIVPRVS